MPRDDARFPAIQRKTAARRLPFLVPGFVLILSLCTPVSAANQQVTGEQVLRSIEGGKQFLLGCQRPDGAWPDVFPYKGGTTAIATLALLHAGVPPDHPKIKSALEVVRWIPLERTYVVSLKAQTLALADPKAYRAEIGMAADWLMRAQHPNGLWGYGQKGDRVDFSNSQFALLGLNEAANAGADVPDTVWRKAEGAYRIAQRQDGGYTYMTTGGVSTGSMTVAAIASLYIVGNSLAVRVPQATTRPGSACCGRYGSYRPISQGLIWLARNFNVEINPAVDHGRTTNAGWYYYYLYGLERVGMLSGLQYIGRHDWYREGVTQIISRQEGNGSWRDNNSISDTAFALLFLAKGHRPVLFQKLKWVNDLRWNTARSDLAHLVGFIGDRIGGRPVSWNVVGLDADIGDWLVSPILYISGQEFPTLKADEIDRLRQYIDMGGTILAEATCSRETTREGFLAFARAAFPDHEPQRLPPDHPVFSAMFNLDGNAIELIGLEVGCRTSVFFSPSDLACELENGDYRGQNKTAFELATNIAVYATGSEPLRDKLAVPLVITRAAGSQPADVPRGALYLAVLRHGGDWQPFPYAIKNLSEFLSRNLGVDTVPDYEALTATDKRLAGHPIIYLTGARSFALSNVEVTALRQHLQRGGFLLADACCGQRLFDTSFRELMAQVFPETPLNRLPPDHPIFTGSPGYRLSTVTYLPTLRQERPDLTEPWLEGITLDGRTAVVYSPFGLGCGLADSACFACRGLAPDDARKLTANILLYALSH